MSSLWCFKIQKGFDLDDHISLFNMKTVSHKLQNQTDR